MNKFFCFSVDVDYVKGSEDGVLELLNFCDQYKLPATYFITGKFALEYPDVVNEIARRGYTIGMHGWDHGEDPDEDFASEDYEYLSRRIKLATDAIESTCGIRPRLFRATNLWIGETALKVLEEYEYTIDSSIPSRRLLGRVRSFKYLWAPMLPYFPSYSHAKRSGEGKLFEIPPSSYFMPINMSSLRMLKVFGLKIFIKLLYFHTPYLNFYVHPAEFVTEDKLKYVYPVPKRHLEGIGPQNFKLLGDLINYLSTKEVKSISLQEVPIE